MITIKPVGKRNPQKPEEGLKFYAQVSASRRLDLDQLADLLSDGSTTRRNDVYAVLVGVTDAIVKQLKEGARVTMGDLGTFYVSVSSTPVDTIDDFNVRQVTGNHIRYLPGFQFKREVANVTYTAAKKK